VRSQSYANRCDSKLPLSQNWERGPGGETGTGDRTTLAGIMRLVEQARITG
jgi:hypothetical protein